MLQHLLEICSHTKGPIQAQFGFDEFVEMSEQPVPIQDL